MKILGWIIFFLMPLWTKAQEALNWGDPLAAISIKQSDLISLDTRDQIFVSTINGDIYLFDREGRQLNLFSPLRQGRLQQLEAAWTVNIFSFSSDLQEYRILDRFLNPLAENNLTAGEITLPKAATLGNNNIIWIWDESDLTLKSLNYLQKQILQSQPLNLILDSQNLDVNEIREFKNRLYMNIPSSGIFIFDNQGNLIQKLDVHIDQRLTFFKERLFWIQKGILKSISLRTLDQTDHGKVPHDQANSIQIGQEILVLQSPAGLQVFALPLELKNLR